MNIAAKYLISCDHRTLPCPNFDDLLFSSNPRISDEALVTAPCVPVCRGQPGGEACQVHPLRCQPWRRIQPEERRVHEDGSVCEEVE